MYCTLCVRNSARWRCILKYVSLLYQLRAYYPSHFSFILSEYIRRNRQIKKISTVYHSKFVMALPNHTNTIGSMYWTSALVSDIVAVLAVDDVRITSGIRVLLADSCVVKNSSSSSSFILTLGSYSVVSREKSPEPEPLPANTSSRKKNN